MGTSAASALTSLGSDLAFSVSYSIATELLDGAAEVHLSEEELIGIVLGISVVLAALPSSVRVVSRELARSLTKEKSGQRSVAVEAAAAAAAAPTPGSVLEFATLLLRMAQRISISICVQLLASNVRSQQPLRSVRVVTLLGVSIFFLFLESVGSWGHKTQQESGG